MAADFAFSEFMAENSGSLLDNYSASSDWIEIHNRGDAAGSLNGYYLTDDAADKTRWRFPDVSIPAGGFLLVYASGQDERVPGMPLHANFELNKEGEYLGLIAPDSLTVVHDFGAMFPAQRADVSYGIGQIASELTLVSAAAAAKTLVPTSDAYDAVWHQPGYTADANWISGPTGVGFAQTVSGFAVRTFQANVSPGSPIGTTVDNIDEALEVIGNPAARTSVAGGNYGTVNFLNTGSSSNSGNYGNNVAFPGQNNPTNYSHFATESRARVTIPTPGDWTFGVRSNEGFLLTIDEFELSRFGTGSTTVDQLETFNFPLAGTYELSLYHFERTGDAWLELFAAPGAFAGWNATNFDLVGDVANGGLAVTSDVVSSAGDGIGALIGTDVRSQMAGVNTTVYTRITFNVADPATLDQLRLRIKYDDGIVAYLNGVEVARRNTIETTGWNASARNPRGDEALTYEDIDITAFRWALVPGQNVLALHGQNASAIDPDLLIAPELYGVDLVSSDFGYFTVATPAAANGSGFVGFVADTQFSADRGFYDAPFSVEITSATPSAQIYYTTNGDAPTPTGGVLYTAPINISSTTTLRAAAFLAGWLPTNVDTQTYLFVDDVVRQTHQATLNLGFPATWGSLTPDYGMDPDVIGAFDTNGNPLGGDLFGGVYAATIKNDLLSIPTLSIVMDLDEMFGPQGIYTNATQRGVAWERATSVEWITNDASPMFQVDAGIRIQGGAFRSDGLTKKHSFRLLFKDIYGPGKLEFPLFGDEAASDFNTLVLRAGANDGYTWNSARFTEQYIRDEFGRSLQSAAGHPSPHGNFAHLYINGVYWGLYNPVERPDHEFAATYLGGEADHWDAIHVAEAPNGDFAAWEAMFAKTLEAGSSLAAYMELQGKNLDGTPHAGAAGPLLDIVNYVDYITLNVWGGNWDWPRKNYWAGRDRNPATTTGFKFFNWDFENTMGNNRSRSPLEATALDQDFTGPDNAGQPHLNLLPSAEYRIMFADRVHKMFFNDGILTPGKLIERYAAIAQKVERAIVAESARWGDMHYTTVPLTLADWYVERDWMLNTYLPQRSAIVLEELKSYNLYSSVAAPAYSQHGGQVVPGFDLTLSAPSGAIWYTLDGSDPRQVGGAVSPGALLNSGPIDIPTGLTVRARALSGSDWSALDEVAFTVAAPADATNLRISELHYNPAGQPGVADPQELEFIELVNPSLLAVSLNGVQLSQFAGTPHVFPNGLTLGAGERLVVAKNPTVFLNVYGTGINLAPTGYGEASLSNGGERIALVGPLGTIQDFQYDDDPVAWPAAADGAGSSLEIVDPLGDPANPANWRASFYRGGSPGNSGLPPSIAGDFDADQDADGADFLAWQRGLGRPALTAWAAHGDADGDREVDAADLAVWQSSFGETASAAKLAAPTQSFSFAALLASDPWIIMEAAPSARATARRPRREPLIDELFEPFNPSSPSRSASEVGDIRPLVRKPSRTALNAQAVDDALEKVFNAGIERAIAVAT